MVNKVPINEAINEVPIDEAVRERGLMEQRNARFVLEYHTRRHEERAQLIADIDAKRASQPTDEK
jgi:hypothetical protein